MSQPEPDNVFHQHLDVCERCRTQPFNLCTTGHLMLLKAVNNICDEFKPPQPKKTRA